LVRTGADGIFRDGFLVLPIDAAFCNADLTTLVGSMTPALTRFSYVPVSALNGLIVTRR
jgi:hypothetical protein